MTDDTEPPAGNQPAQPTDTHLDALQNSPPEYTLDDECIAVPKATIAYLIENTATQALGVRKHGDTDHYETLCHRLAELRLAYQAHTAFEANGYGDPITITIPDRAFGLVFERAKRNYTELFDNQHVSDTVLDDIEGAFDALDAARVNTVTGHNRSTTD